MKPRGWCDKWWDEHYKVVTTQDVLEFQKVPREQIKTSLVDKEVSTLLVVATTDKKTISKHAEI